jgi:MFS superfamily sulfate permease-like transporter
MPIVSWLPSYDRRDLLFDAIAGATIWGMLAPEMIAYAGLAGLPPQMAVPEAEFGVTGRQSGSAR